MLNLAFRESLVAAEQERLHGHIYLLLAAADLVGEELKLPQRLTEPRFGRLNSGLYAFVTDVNGNQIWRSPSAAVLEFKPAQNREFYPGSVYFQPLSTPDQDYYQFDFDVVYETESGLSKPYRFTVLHSQEEIKRELTAYRNQLWWLLGGLAILLLVTQTVIMRWGLRPLRTMVNDLAAVEQGRTESLSGSYPGEIQPVTDNLNRVLKTARMQRDRYKNTLSDLAHSLKTPLAVIRGAMQQRDNQMDVLIDEQIIRMDQIISHQLQRAVFSDQTRLGTKIKVSELVARISDALNKVYQDKQVELQITAERDCSFHGSESDLMELLGNILDNAYKYCNRRITVDIRCDDDDLIIYVADDGAGVDGSLQDEILQRGARADTLQPGQGIGLAVAVDIISGYKGSLSIERSKLDGAGFKIILPYNH